MGESKKSFWLATITGFIIVVVCELIGQHTLKMGKVSIVLFPMLYAVLIGLFITPDLLGSKITALKKVIGEKEINLAGELVGITLIVLGIKYGSTVGPNIQKILMAGPAFGFATIIGLLLTMPYNPISVYVTEYIGNVGFMSITTPILAFAGISVGNKIVELKKMSWRIVLISLLVFTTIFFACATIAHIVLSIQGVI